MDGVWIDPVTAHVMMTFLDFAMVRSSQLLKDFCARLWASSAARRSFRQRLFAVISVLLRGSPAVAAARSIFSLAQTSGVTGRDDSFSSSSP
jgi:hypothetical protein